MKAEASKVKTKSKKLSTLLSERAKHYVNEGVWRSNNAAYYKKKAAEEPAEKVIAISIEEIVFRAVVDEIKQLDNNQNPERIKALEADLQKKVDQAIEDATFDEEKYRSSADYYEQLYKFAIEDEEKNRKLAGIFKISASEASNLYKLFIRKVKRAKQVKKSFQAKQDAQIKKVKHFVQKLMAAQDGKRPRLRSNYGAILPEKPTYASQVPIAAHAAPIIHLDTGSHVIPAPKELDLTSSLSNPPNVGMKLKRKDN
ncbi:hypothetical protein Plhal304r1_c008g0031891 [Plasmopara halstedii]